MCNNKYLQSDAHLSNDIIEITRQEPKHCTDGERRGGERRFRSVEHDKSDEKGWKNGRARDEKRQQRRWHKIERKRIAKNEKIKRTKWVRDSCVAPKTDQQKCGKEQSREKPDQRNNRRKERDAEDSRTLGERVRRRANGHVADRQPGTINNPQKRLGIPPKSKITWENRRPQTNRNGKKTAGVERQKRVRTPFSYLGYFPVRSFSMNSCCPLLKGYKSIGHTASEQTNTERFFLLPNWKKKEMCYFFATGK